MRQLQGDRPGTVAAEARMRRATMWKLQWAMLAAGSLVAASWANGTASLWHLSLAAAVGALFGWAFAHWVLR